MLSQIIVIAKHEFKSLIRSWITIIGFLCIIVVPLILDSPLRDGFLWIPTSAAYGYNHGAVTIGMMFAPLAIAAVYYKDNITGMPIIIFSQPIVSRVYAVGKFLGAYIYCLFIPMIGNIIYMCMPLFFGKAPYTPYPFLKAFFLYTTCSMLMVVAVAYFIDVIFNKKILTIFIPLLYSIGISESLPSQYSIRINEEKLATLAGGETLIIDLKRFILFNRSFVLIIGMLLILISIIMFSPKRLMKKR